MSSLASVDTAFALVLASQTDAVGATPIEAITVSGATMTPSVARLLATIDPTRSAFASALQRIDVANAPGVSGPYVPGAASGPLTEDDIFDPSRLYSLPGQDVVIFRGDADPHARTGIVRPGRGDAPALELAHGLDAAGTDAFDDDVEADVERSTTPPPSARGVALGSGPLADTMPAALDGRQPALALELAVAGYLSLLKAALSPTRRKGPRLRETHEDTDAAYRARTKREGRDAARTDEKGDETAPF